MTNRLLCCLLCTVSAGLIPAASGDPIELLQEGARLMRMGYPVLAIRAFREAAREGAPEVTVGLRIADAYCALGEFDAADRALDPVLKAAPGLAEATLLKARIQLRQQRYAASWQWFRGYLEQQPGDDDVRMDYALSLAWGRRFADALVEFEKLAGAGTYRLEARFRIAEVLAWQAEYPRARAALADLLAGSPDKQLRVRCHVLLGRMSAWCMELEAAEAEYLKAIELDEHAVDAYLALGEVCEWRGQVDKARAHYARAVEVAPGSDVARSALRRVAGS